MNEVCEFFGVVMLWFFFQAEDGIRDKLVTGVQTCALPIYGLPVVMDHAEGRITMAHFVWSDDPGGDEIVNLIESDPLRAQFFPARIKTFYSAFDEDKRHFRLVHLLFDA